MYQKMIKTIRFLLDLSNNRYLILNLEVYFIGLYIFLFNQIKNII